MPTKRTKSTNGHHGPAKPGNGQATPAGWVREVEKLMAGVASGAITLPAPRLETIVRADGNRIEATFEIPGGPCPVCSGKGYLFADVLPHGSPEGARPMKVVKDCSCYAPPSTEPRWRQLARERAEGKS